MLNARLMQAYAMVNVSINLLELRAWTYQVYIALSDRSLIENGIDKKDRLYSTDGSLHIVLARRYLQQVIIYCK